MIVRITPPGRRSRCFTVSGVRRSWDINGGCATASIPLALSAEDRERILLARVDIFGPLGLDWTGVVWRKPRSNAAIEAAGQAVGLTLTPRERHYADTSLQFQDYDGTDWNGLSRSLTGGVLNFAVSTTASASANDRIGVWRWYDVPLDSLAFSADVNHADVSIEIFSSDTPGACSTSVYTKPATGSQTGQTASISGKQGYVVTMKVDTNCSGSSDRWVQLWDLIAYELSTTAITPRVVIDDCLDALPTWILPAGASYRGFLDTPAVSIASLDFADKRSTDKGKVDAVVAMTADHFGFYPRWIGGLKAGVPVLKAISTSPDVALDVRAVVSETLQERGADGLANQYRVTYNDEQGVNRVTAIDDTSADNYLNAVGYDKTADVDATWTASETLAQAIGTQAAATAAAQDVEGQVVIRRARLANGREVSPLYVMPGMMARVRGLPGGARDLIVRSAEATDTEMALTFAPTFADLRYLAAKARGDSVVRY